jgi:hypothetical protein
MTGSFPLFLSCMALSAASGNGPNAAVLENPALRVEFRHDENLLSVYDKRNGQWWRQFDTSGAGEDKDSPHVEQKLIFTQELAAVDAASRTLTLEAMLPGTRRNGDTDAARFTLTATLDETAPRLSLRFDPHIEGEWFEVTYPYAFYLTGDDAYVLFPHCEGLLIPANTNDPAHLRLGKDYIYNGYGAYCACMGLVDLASGRGMLTIYDTPEIAGYEMSEIAVDGATVAAPRIFWRGNKFAFDRPRQATFTFSHEGGYVRLAQQYRESYKAKGLYRSLESKNDANPNVNKMAGAPVFWVFEKPAEVLEVAQMMREDGIEHALVNVGLSYWFRMEGREAEAKALEDVVRRIGEMGYIISRYDQYRDCFEKDPEASIYHQMNTDAYPDMVVITETGEKRKGWPPGYVMNPRLGLELAKQHIPPDLARYAYNGRFIDCIGTCCLWESEDWAPEHLLDSYGGKEAREAILAYANAQGLVCGTEGSMDCFLGNLHWLETPMSLVKWTVSSLPYPGWDPVPLEPDYQVSISRKYRIPFYSLVHHDEIVITWRWEDGFPRLPEYWQDKNLWSVLYGNPPMFFLNPVQYKKWRPAIAQTYRYVCGWTRKTAYAELTSHRFISEDWEVQETTFSTGEGVVVNFSGEPYTLPDGWVVPARDYLSFTRSGADESRHYTPPAVDVMDYEKQIATEN